MIAAPNKRKKRRNQVDPYDRGTPETRRKLQRESTFERLMKNERKKGNRHVDEIERAAYEVERVYFHLTRSLFAKSSSLERVDGGTPADTPAWIVSAYTERYVPWADVLRGMRKSRAHAVIIDVLIENESLKNIERDKELPRGMARQIILSFLKLYADMAGWGSKKSTQHVVCA